jgi:hypothetical protein
MSLRETGGHDDGALPRDPADMEIPQTDGRTENRRLCPLHPEGGRASMGLEVFSLNSHSDKAGSLNVRSSALVGCL